MMNGRKSNCILEAVRAGIKDKWRGYLNFRPSACGRFFHCTYTKYCGTVVNFVPPSDKPRKPFPPLYFTGSDVGNDDAWRFRVLLQEFGIAKKRLRKMSDDEVTTMFNSIASERQRMAGDPS